MAQQGETPSLSIMAILWSFLTLFTLGAIVLHDFDSGSPSKMSTGNPPHSMTPSFKQKSQHKKKVLGHELWSMMFVLEYRGSHYDMYRCRLFHSLL